MFAKLKRMAARFPTYRTYIKERPSWLAVLFFGRILAFRRLERQIMRAKPFRPVMAEEQSVTALAPGAITEVLVRDGVYTGLKLDPAAVVEILHFAEATPCTTRSLPRRTFLPKDLAVANEGRKSGIISAYYFDAVDQCSAIKEIERDPLVTDTAAAFIGTEPRHIRTRLWWSFPSDHVTEADMHAAAQNRYHFDLNDFRTLKFFFYITDVDAKSGPHHYIRGSHRRRLLKHQLTAMVGHDEGELRDFYHASDFRAVTGLAGTGFIEDPFVFHCGRLCDTKPRLVLEIEFGPSMPSESYRYGVLG